MSHATAVHPNSALTPTGRLQMVERHLRDRSPIAHVAAEFRVSWDTVNKWVTRYLEHGAAGLVDVSSAPHRRPSQIPPAIVGGSRRYAGC